MTLAPIILFVYNRPDHTSKTLEALCNNTLASESSLHIFSDGPKTERNIHQVNEVRRIISTVKGFKEVIIYKEEKNKGLANSVIDGVSKILQSYNEVIILEDDIVTAPNFLAFMNNAFQLYDSNKNIFSVTGYVPPIKIPNNYAYPVYLSYRGSSWGWGIWKDRWNSIDWEIKDKHLFLSDKSIQRSFNRGGSDLSNMLIRQFDGKIDSWAIRSAYNAFKQNKLHLNPTHSLVQNIGHDNSGVHSGKTDKYAVQLTTDETDIILPQDIPFDKAINDAVYNLFKKPLHKKIIVSILRFLNLLK